MTIPLQGSCHCQAVKFTLDAPIKDTVTCNCSICGRTGAIYLFVPESAVKIISGEDNITDYQFGKKTIHHGFCKTCGVRTFGYGKDEQGDKTYAINLRTVEDIDLDSLEPMKYDGKHM